MKKQAKKTIAYGIMLVIVSVMAGCSDPQTLGRFRATPVTNIILPSLGVVDEEPALFADARDPRSEDLRDVQKEYIMSPGDTLMINIMDLFQTGQEWVGSRQINEAGRITLPEIGTVQAAGLSETELTKVLVGKLSPDFILEPTVSVVVVNSTVKTYSIDGAVAVPARYQLINPNLRILEAFAEAGGFPQTGADYAYVIRTSTPESGTDEAAQPAEESYGTREATIQEPEIQEPKPEEAPAVVPPPVDVEAKPMEPKPAEGASQDVAPEQPRVIEPKTDKPEIERKPEPVKDPEDELLESIGPVSKKFQNAPEPVDDQEVMIYAADLPEGDLVIPVAPGDVIFDFESSSASLQLKQEVIRIDLKSLQSGDLSQNILIRPGDYIRVPFNATGVFYVMGQVTGPGPYQLRGEQMTLKQAMATVGGLTPLASPERCDIIRRIGGNKEVTCKVNLRKLFEGTQPDIYLRPNDTINVGSHPTARWVAVIRNSFRYTYGFGFVYDRNLADKDFGH